MTKGADAPGEAPGSAAEAGAPARAAANPYSTGGGGVTLERRVAARYLALLLTGEGAPELGDGRAIVSVAFQQAPRVPVDDLVILAARPDEMHPSLELAVGVRRAPNIVPSDEATQKLVVEYVRALLAAPADGREHRLALVVAGPQGHAGEVAELARLASDQMDARGFFTLIQTPGKFRQALVTRLAHLKDLVAQALTVLGTSGPDDILVRLRTWELLARLSVLMPRVEEPDVSDWVHTRNSLVAAARGNDLAAAGRLLDRLEVLTAQYGPSAAVVDLTILRRDVHSLLEADKWRHQQGWAAIGHLQEQAAAAVRHSIGAGDAGQILHVDRAGDGAEVVAIALSAAGTVVQGESGTGKSALVLEAVTAAAAADLDEMQAVCLNLRQLPEISLDLVKALGCSLQALLGELSAPARLLVIDAADAALETRGDMFTYLVIAARASGVKVVAISAAEGWEVVRDLMAA